MCAISKLSTPCLNRYCVYLKWNCPRNSAWNVLKTIKVGEAALKLRIKTFKICLDQKPKNRLAYFKISMLFMSSLNNLLGGGGVLVEIQEFAKNNATPSCCHWFVDQQKWCVITEVTKCQPCWKCTKHPGLKSLLSLQQAHKFNYQIWLNLRAELSFF